MSWISRRMLRRKGNRSHRINIRKFILCFPIVHFLLGTSSKGIRIQCCRCFFGLVVEQDMAEPEKFRSMDRSSPIFQQSRNLLFLHIARIFKLRDAIQRFGEISGFNKICRMIFDLLPWNTILFPARCKT